MNTLGIISNGSIIVFLSNQVALYIPIINAMKFLG
jgi:hypothetical protein